MKQKRKIWNYVAALLILSFAISAAAPDTVQAAGRKNRVLVVYFTRGDNVKSKEKLDATSSASINISNKKRVGNTELVAKKIKKQTGGDIFSIKVKSKYTNDYDSLVDLAEKELEDNARPRLANRVKNMKKYDTVILCYPVWWSSTPMAVRTFLDSYDFSGKTIYACATHGGSGFGDSIGDIKESSKGAKVKKGFSVYGSSVKKSDKKVKKLAKQIKAAKN